MSNQFAVILFISSYNNKQACTVWRNSHLKWRCCTQGLKKSTSPIPGARNFHMWASWNNQLYARRASKKIYRILTNFSIFVYLLIFIYVICCLISSNVLFILQSVHLLYKYAIRIHFCFIRTRRINFSAYE